MLKKLLLPIAFAAVGVCVSATPVKVTMNAVSTTMSIAAKTGGNNIEVGEPTSRVYTFDAPAGEYILTAYATNGATVNGTIAVSIPESSEEQVITVITCTAYVTNKTDGVNWTVEDGDYDLNVTVRTRDGLIVEQTTGNSITAGRYTFLALNGNSYNADFVPSPKRVAEGYTSLYKAGTLTGNINVNGAIPLGGEYSITIPADAELQLNRKVVHFADFVEIEPSSIVEKGDTKEYTFYLAQGQVYNYRTWKSGGLTQGGHFTFNEESKCPVIAFTSADYEAFNPHTINHDVKSNGGYETGDILVNINERGHLALNLGDTFKAHAMRMWEISDNSTNNYFIEPDFHYTVVGLDGKPSSDVIEIAQTPGSAWADIKAVGAGTAIVLVTYDAIGLNYYSGTNKSAYMGGEFWGAIWPENTAAYVVTVGQTPSIASPNMFINESYNTGALKVAGKYVDAEHDVFYYLDSEGGYTYTFSPEGVADVTIAYPTIGEQMASYAGFSSTGVTKNADGSFSLLLKEGRQIVCLTDAAGNSSYQVLTAKTCSREITNMSRPGSQIFQPGDDIKIQYSGLRHPANKIAGIYNMSAYVTYNGIPNGSSLILGSGQYTFGSAASAQAVTVSVPMDIDIETQPSIAMTDGVIQVNGYGDPIGNHRIIDPIGGRSPNFTAVAHKTYFGALPDVIIPLSQYKTFKIRLESNVTDADVTVSFNGKEISADETSKLYEGTYGDYEIVAKADGYRAYHHTFSISDSAEGEQVFAIAMTKGGENMWNGKDLMEPKVIDGVYEISSGAELAWFATQVNNGNSADARLVDNIDLGDYDWTPMGSSSKSFANMFDGCGYEISGLYVNTPNANYGGLFGYVKAMNGEVPATVKNLTVSGSVIGKGYTGGIAGYVQQYTTIDRCVNNVNVSGTNYVGGIAGYLGVATSAVTNCVNLASVQGSANSCGGIVGNNYASAVIENVINLGEVYSLGGACVGGTTAKNAVKNAFSTQEYGITAGQTLVTTEQMESGEVAWLLGESFGQTIGEDSYPQIGGIKVFRVSYSVVEPEDQPSLFDLELPTIYTNGTLPEKIDSQIATWFEDEEMTQPVTTVDADKTLYVTLTVPTFISNISADNTAEARWFNLRGVEVSAPAPDDHGVYIRVYNGKATKILK